VTTNWEYQSNNQSTHYRRYGFFVCIIVEKNTVINSSSSNQQQGKHGQNILQSDKENIKLTLQSDNKQELSI
jgi:hypothetical protein